VYEEVLIKSYDGIKALPLNIQKESGARRSIP
jgi:hypothetical protein